MDEVKGTPEETDRQLLEALVQRVPALTEAIRLETDGWERDVGGLPTGDYVYGGVLVPALDEFWSHHPAEFAVVAQPLALLLEDLLCNTPTAASVVDVSFMESLATRPQLAAALMPYLQPKARRRLVSALDYAGYHF